MRTIEHTFDSYLPNRGEVRIIAIYDYYPPHDFKDFKSVVEIQSGAEIVNNLTRQEEEDLIEYALEQIQDFDDEGIIW